MKEKLISKVEFDNIIKKPIDSSLFGYKTITDGYYDVYFNNDEFKKYIENMKTNYPEAYKKYDEGKGGELDEYSRKDKKLPPKMASVASSSRFCYLAFRDGVEVNSVVGVPDFEHSCEIPEIPGIPPQLDAFFKDSNAFFEVKCHEIFDSHKIEMKMKYKDKVCGEKSDFHLTFDPSTIKGEGNETKFTIALSEFGISEKSTMFDIKQLLCHLMGIASTGLEVKHLYFLFFKPKCENEEDIQEIEKVFDKLTKEINCIFNSTPIREFCERNNISLHAWAEYSETMTALTPDNYIELYA